ncbi:MAG TPA: C40 family peptidase [Armatimonadota bacterium]|nr:C40 family peptidase [Armatimonadota bacterium]
MQGVIIKNVANLHRDKSADSEQVTQAIMGQTVQIEKDEGEWLYVKTWDTYHGWIQSCWVNRGLPQPTTIVTVTSLFTDALWAPDPDGEIWTKLVITTSLEFLDKQGDLIHVRLPDGNEAWLMGKDAKLSVSGEEKLPLGPIASELVLTAKQFLGVPYLWGGTTPFGLDCSGFLQLVYKIHGVRLVRDAHMQANDPRQAAVEKPDLAPGDLIFFAHGEDKGKVAHVGIACGDGTFIHSTANIGVTISRLDDDPYRRNYWGAGRIGPHHKW